MEIEQALPGAASAGAATRIRRIEARRGLVKLDLREIWRYRELLYFLVWRDIKARYRQTVLGSFWAIFRPFVQMVIFTVIFAHLAGIKTGSDLPYPLFVYPPLLMITFFTSALNGGSASIVGNAQLVTKAYFPRIYLPAAAVLAPLVDFLLSFTVLVGLFAWYGRAPSWHVVFLPAYILLALVLALGLALWFGAFTVRYRDVPYALPFLTQVWMYATPVIYPASLVPSRFHWLLALNPLSGIAIGSRWSLVGGSAPSVAFLAGSISISFVVAVTGLIYFRRREPTFPDFV